jgi:peptide subunit release factor 1 (eRF1)
LAPGQGSRAGCAFADAAASGVAFVLHVAAPGKRRITMPDISELLARLRGVHAPRPEVVSVYLSTRWLDEHQRDRVRVFLTRELRRARETGEASAKDLDWIELEGRTLVDQGKMPEAHGVALFACQALGLRELVPFRVPVAEMFVVAASPDLRPLVEMLDEHASAMVVFVDGESGRLITLHPTGAEEEVHLEADVPGHHRRGGWAQLSQSRYARHIETHRGQHFEAVAQAVIQAVDARGIQRIVLAGQEDRLAAFRKHLPDRLQPLVVGYVHAGRWESASTILARATARLDLQEHSDEGVGLDDLLTGAAKGGRAVVGPGTLEAARRGAIHRLYILAGLHRAGRACERCAALQETGASCWLCAGPTREVDLGAALTERVVATGGSVEAVVEHAGLAAAGGMAARLRYPL